MAIPHRPPAQPRRAEPLGDVLVESDDERRAGVPELEQPSRSKPVVWRNVRHGLAGVASELLVGVGQQTSHQSKHGEARVGVPPHARDPVRRQWVEQPVRRPAVKLLERLFKYRP